VTKGYRAARERMGLAMKICSIRSCDRVQHAAVPQRRILVDALLVIRPRTTVLVDDVENLF